MLRMLIVDRATNNLNIVFFSECPFEFDSKALNLFSIQDIEEGNKENKDNPEKVLDTNLPHLL